ncbi:MAG: hypothetical protein N2235_00045 [Fischerella sp.]|nr:hypothetical protein [Fischerella sp.]
MPMEELKLPNFNKEYRQACNAEEALLAVLNACARVTKNLSQIQWHYSIIKTSEAGEKTYFKDFGAWISKLHRQRVDLDKDVSSRFSTLCENIACTTKLNLL